jgi:cyclic beta-1,2-glucan synthetase
MNRLGEKAEEFFSRMRAYFQDKVKKNDYINEEPLRSELFTTAQMAQYGKALAQSHILSSRRSPDQLLGRLADNEKVLLEVRGLLTEPVNANYLITPAGEWLIDNFYLIEEQIRTAKRHLPKGYSENLPQLVNGNTKGLTRVYDLALQIISHSDGRIDIESLSSFVNAYQSVTNLQLGELWAIPIMLRLALLENLRRVSARIAIDRLDRNLADHWSRKMIQVSEKDPANLIVAIADMTRSAPPLVSAFVTELSRQLSGKGPGLALALTWVEQRLSENGQTSIELIFAENQKQAADQVSMRNSIGSLRMLSEMDWRDFVENHSIVEQTFRTDPAGVYADMDFPTRDRYRHVVEHISKKSALPEADVAAIVVSLSENSQPETLNRELHKHIGYFLVGDGFPETCRRAKMSRSFKDRLGDAANRNSFFFYFTAILLVTAGITTGLYLKTRTDQSNDILILLIAALSFICSSQLAITLVNFFVTLMVNPRLLSRMDFSKGIPEEHATLVAIPVMLGSKEEIDDMTEALEVRFLANRDENLRFGLLTDFMDAPSETMPGDTELENKVQFCIKALNIKYAKAGEEIFYLLHRPRRWNAADHIWMGYERKRGKLAELNALLRGKGKDRFSLIVGNIDKLQQVRYVITLDADTQLPRGAAWKLTATMAHPLNKARYDEKKQRVTSGYGILQPRVDVSLPELTASHYAKLHGNEPGIDPYTRATSDVYQDLFAEGSFIGKGIYDVDIFEKALGGKFPENRILSHDLLEGCYTRSGLLSDVQLYEKYPSTYAADVKRRSRWIRGDWQIAAWFTPFVPGADGHWKLNPLSALSRWKILDNIRRSLVSLALTIFIVLGWTVLKDPLFWTLIVSAIIVLPLFVTTAWDFIRKPKDLVFHQHVIYSALNAGGALIKTFFSLICLPHEAIYNLKAILITCWRMLFSHKKLLEWNPSAREEQFNQRSLAGSYFAMQGEPALAFAVAVYLVLYAPLILGIASPILLLWITAPFVTWWTSKPLAKKSHGLKTSQLLSLHALARRTWAFFERFVTAEDNWLPPDNFQEHPVGITAHRTSPTNIGLYFLSSLAAFDFGFISQTAFLERVEQSLGTLTKLEKYKGHLYNWYDTLTLQPLLPKYISTVDSGNLTGHLLTLKQGLLETIHRKICDERLFEGLLDTTGVYISYLKKETAKGYEAFQSKLRSSIEHKPAASADFFKILDELSTLLMQAHVQIDTTASPVTSWWKEKLSQQLASAITSLELLRPWTIDMPQVFGYLTVLTGIPSLLEISKAADQLENTLHSKPDGSLNSEDKQWFSTFKLSVVESSKQARDRIAAIERMAQSCDELSDMEWDFLYDKGKNLLSIGYKSEEHQTDPSFYDLLASEARLGVFVCIAESKIPEESWFALGRLVTNPGRAPVLLSWSGSMFEYLMPLLVMPTYANTLLDQTYKAAVERQIEYGKQLGVPWGNSESGYNMVDVNSNYQYRAFGTPGLGLKRGLGEELVVAPYATVLALMIEPEKACKNIEQMQAEGFEGDYGFYEAVDYTPSRLQRGQVNVVIQSYMAHHQGMSLLSLTYLLLNLPMQRRFEAEPRFQATLLLLQEKIPKATSYYAHTTSITEKTTVTGGNEVRVINTPHTPVPEVQLLSNGKYHVMVSNSGAGYSRWKDLAVTRWREDGTCDNWGTFCYIRDLDSDMYWSGTYQPSQKLLKNYEAAFSQSRVDFRGSKNNIESHIEIVVSSEDDIEMRRLNLTNHSSIERTLEITSYAEVVLASPASDAMQPAFSNLFVETSILPESKAILCTRRPRSSNEVPPWMFNLVSAEGVELTSVSYETDRLAFIGRGNTALNPAAMNHAGPLSGSQGSVLDPVVAIRYTLTLKPEQSVRVDMITGISETREGCLGLIEKYHDSNHKDRVFELAWTHSQVILRHINASQADTLLYGKLVGSVIFANSSLRADSSVLIENRRGQSGLWGYSISGDLPIVLVKIADQKNIQLVKQLIQAHTYWNLKGLLVDLVIWNEDHGGYRQALQNQIQGLIASEMTDKPGGIFVRAADQISNEDRILFHTVSRVILSDADGTLADHLNRKAPSKVAIPYLPVVSVTDELPEVVEEPKDLIFYNGLGGFSPDGTEYIIHLNNKMRSPAPWSNVLANPNFGTVISESGQAYTWAENAHEFRLSPWNNDPVTDAAGEAYYLRDEDTGRFWSPTVLPRCGKGMYTVRHGMGYSVFEHTEEGIHTEMWVYVDIEYTVKFTVLKVKNVSGKARRLSATGYVEWVLGDLRSKTAMHIFTELDPGSWALLARNPYNSEFAERIAFFDVDDRKRTFTGDRAEFIGRNGTLQNPDAMNRIKLSGRLGGGLDPCSALQVSFDLAAGEEKEIIFRLGSTADATDVSNFVRQFRGSDEAALALSKVREYWQHALGALQIETPDAATNILTNGWLTYQVLASRLWGRSGYYQSGGAFGFRDQLQDVLSLFHSEPDLARQQILLAASRQFREGDVQHWWHPPTGRGVRTRCSDDYLWLPYVASRYVNHTGDKEMLNQLVPYLEGRLLNPDEESYYDLPSQGKIPATLYEHCVKAIEHGFRYGEHGLPLMGTGDWNDGMDRVGKHGKGESVWLGFFLYEVLNLFIEVANLQKDTDFAARCEKEAALLKNNIEQNGWDGDWYRRAYFDDGSPLGSAQNEECRIDSLSQSWSVISGVASKERSLKAMESAHQHLVHPKDALICLLEPPFDKAAMDPGYIKGYVPGVRENGGQYTHAAIWLIIAFAKLGDRKRTWELLQMINPINHGRTAAEIDIYKVEPYVIAGDVYGLAPFTGHGGWTWYSGSAGWMYQLITEHFLGLRQTGSSLSFAPCVPAEWNTFKVRYRYKTANYNIVFKQNNTGQGITIKLDGMAQSGQSVVLNDDKQTHEVEVEFSSRMENLTALPETKII